MLEGSNARPEERNLYPCTAAASIMFEWIGDRQHITFPTQTGGWNRAFGQAGRGAYPTGTSKLEAVAISLSQAGSQPQR